MYETIVNREYKSTVFQMLFSEKRELLELYNALRGTEYTNVDDLTVTTLKDAVFMGVKNDVSFIFQSRLYLFEHQSTRNPNMPLRDLYYVSELLRGMTANKNIYSSTIISIPEPRFVVFYNGKQEQPDRMEYRLSDLYEKKTEDPALELRVLVLNVNVNHNAELMKACRTLREYSLFVQKIRDYAKTMNHKEAVKKAVVDCIEEGILKDFLMKHKAEAINVSIYEFDAEQYERFVREEGRVEGRKEGRAEGEARMSRLVSALYECGRGDEVIRAASDKVYREKLYEELKL